MEAKIKLSKSVNVSDEFRIKIDKWLLGLFGHIQLTKNDNPDCKKCFRYSKTGKAEMCLSAKTKETYLQIPSVKQKNAYWCPEGRTR